MHGLKHLSLLPPKKQEKCYFSCKRSKGSLNKQMGCSYLITERKPMNAANCYQTQIPDSFTKRLNNNKISSV